VSSPLLANFQLPARLALRAFASGFTQSRGNSQANPDKAWARRFTLAYHHE
jgi:hypothetical protein